MACRLISIQIGGHRSYQRKCVNISPISELLLAGQQLITPKETVSVNGIMELYGNLKESQWETILPEVLHSIRSLLCTTTNATSHERLFSYQRQTPIGHSLPTWLSTPGPVLLRCHVQASKYEPLVDEAILLEANPQYAHIRFTNGRESTVYVSDLAPAMNSLQSGDIEDDNIQKD